MTKNKSNHAEDSRGFASGCNRYTIDSILFFFLFFKTENSNIVAKVFYMNLCTAPREDYDEFFYILRHDAEVFQLFGNRFDLVER